MKWIRFDEHKPENNNWAYLISGHEWFGIGFWKEGKWESGFLGEFPGGDDGNYFPPLKNNNNQWLNESVLYWAEIPDYPIY